MRTELNGARGRVLKGADEFKEILSYFDGQFKSNRGAWGYGDNLAKVNEVTAAGKTLEQAALETWTGQQAIKAGYGKVTVVSFEGKAGSYAKVNVLFHK